MQNRDLISKTWSVLLATIPGFSDIPGTFAQASGTRSPASSHGPSDRASPALIEPGPLHVLPEVTGSGDTD